MKFNILYRLKLRSSKALENLNFLQIVTIFLILLGLWAVFDLSTNILAEFLWFEELNYLPVLITKLQTETSLWIITFVITSVFFLANLRVASIFKYQKNNNRKTEVDEEMMLIPPVTMPSSKLRIEPSFNLGGLLCLVLGLILLIGLILTHYIQVFTDYWHPDFTVAKV
ncbi:MAG: COG1615 family transporter, partial [Okeania sp. SIO3H1]|nr:COG1615 family transporter [Okeania sp. SIO3H1]